MDRQSPPVQPSAHFPAWLDPMLATSQAHRFGSPGWIYEPKFDGFRALVFIADGRCEIRSRRGLRMTHHYPRLTEAAARAARSNCILDAELVAFDEKGRPCFDRLQGRLNLAAPENIAGADRQTPTALLVFDLLHANDRTTLREPLVKRKQLLSQTVQFNEHIQLIEHFLDGQSLYNACLQLGHEGVMAKRANSIYEPGRRSPNWIKLKPYRSAEFVVAGFSLTKGGMLGTIGSLLLGQYNSRGDLVYKGSVGSGFSDRTLAQIADMVAPLVTKSCPFSLPPADRRDAVWLTPHVVAQVKFMTWTEDGKLRVPVFERFRPDLAARQVVEAS